MPDYDPSITEHLLCFFAAMHEWETSCASRRNLVRRGELSPEAAERTSRQQLAEVQQRFTIDPEGPGRGVTFSIPPEYDSTVERISDVRQIGDVATVRTQVTRPPFTSSRWEYMLRRTGDGWRLLNKRSLLNPDGTTTEGPL